MKTASILVALAPTALLAQTTGLYYTSGGNGAYGFFQFTPTTVVSAPVGDWGLTLNASVTDTEFSGTGNVAQGVYAGCACNIFGKIQGKTLAVTFTSQDPSNCDSFNNGYAEFGLVEIDSSGTVCNSTVATGAGPMPMPMTRPVRAPSAAEVSVRSRAGRALPRRRLGAYRWDIAYLMRIPGFSSPNCQVVGASSPDDVTYVVMMNKKNIKKESEKEKKRETCSKKPANARALYHRSHANKTHTHTHTYK
jgi:hypothetical protein